MSASGLMINAVTVDYGETVAVNALSLDVAEGEVVALVGPSGCGKSTLLRCIAGLEQPDSGSIFWNGTDLGSLAPHERDVGLMFQDHALFAHRSVSENIGFGPRMRGATAAEQRTRTSELLRLVDLDGFGDRRIDELSGGEAQRVALARALAPDPAILLLDEPLGALDRALRETLVDELRTLLRTLHQTTIHVTHDQDEAFAIADRVAIMDEGVLRRLGTPQDVWNDPQSQFVARFLGHPVVSIDGQLHAVAPGAAQILSTVPEVSTPDGPTLEATVTDCRFRGDRWEIRLRPPATTADSPTDEGFIAYQSEPLAVGATTSLRLDPSRCHAITAD